MIRLTLQILTGLVLCGCTVNNFHSTVTNYDQRSTELFTSVDTFQERKESSIKTTAEVTASGAEGNMKIRSNCEIYTPLPVPKPVKIDFKELEAADSAREINAIALRNVKELHIQLYSYATRQQKHYNEYLQRCAVK